LQQLQFRAYAAEQKAQAAEDRASQFAAAHKVAQATQDQAWGRPSLKRKDGPGTESLCPKRLQPAMTSDDLYGGTMNGVFEFDSMSSPLQLGSPISELDDDARSHMEQILQQRMQETLADTTTFEANWRSSSARSASQPRVATAIQSSSAPQPSRAPPEEVKEPKVVELMIRSAADKQRSSFVKTGNFKLVEKINHNLLRLAAQRFSNHADAEARPKQAARKLAESMTANEDTVGDDFDAWIACCKQTTSQKNLIKMHLGMVYRKD
jgi:hypothetical protein